jgi:hypothetical protein
MGVALVIIHCMSEYFRYSYRARSCHSATPPASKRPRSGVHPSSHSSAERMARPASCCATSQASKPPSPLPSRCIASETRTHDRCARSSPLRSVAWSGAVVVATQLGVAQRVSAGQRARQAIPQARRIHASQRWRVRAALERDLPGLPAQRTPASTDLGGRPAEPRGRRPWISADWSRRHALAIRGRACRRLTGPWGGARKAGKLPCLVVLRRVEAAVQRACACANQVLAPVRFRPIGADACPELRTCDTEREVVVTRSRSRGGLCRTCPSPRDGIFGDVDQHLVR